MELQPRYYLAHQGHRNRRAGGHSPPPPFRLADQLTASQPGGQIMPTTSPQIFKPPDRPAHTAIPYREVQVFYRDFPV